MKGIWCATMAKHMPCSHGDVPTKNIMHDRSPCVCHPCTDATVNCSQFFSFCQEFLEKNSKYIARPQSVWRPSQAWRIRRGAGKGKKLDIQMLPKVRGVRSGGNKHSGPLWVRTSAIDMKAMLSSSLCKVECFKTGLRGFATARKHQ